MRKHSLLFLPLFALIALSANSANGQVNAPAPDPCDDESGEYTDPCDDSDDAPGPDPGPPGFGELDPNTGTGSVGEIKSSDDTCEACLGSFSLRIALGGAPHEFGLRGGTLKIHKANPSPVIFTPQGLVFEDLLETFVGRVDSVNRRVAIIRYNGKGITYAFPAGSFQGYPVDSMAHSSSRMLMLDSNGGFTSSMGEAVAFERVFPTGGMIRYDRESQLATFIETGSGRIITSANRGVEVIREKRHGLDVIRQVKGSRAFADVRTDPNDSYGYEIHLFAPAQVGSKDALGVYQLTGSPHTVWRVENPNQSDTNLDQVLVTKTAGSKSWEFFFEYTPSVEEWSLTRGNPFGAYRVERNSVLSEPGWPTTVGARSAITRELYDHEPGIGDLLVKEVNTRQIFAWGRERVKKVEDPDGLALTTTYAFYTNASEPGRYGRQKSAQYPDGQWLVYDYDLFGRTTVEKRGWLDAPFDAAAGASRVLEYSYDAVDPGDDDYGLNPVTEADFGSFPRKPRQVVEKIAGQEVRRTYHAYKIVSGERVVVEERAAAVGAGYGATGNRRTVRTYYPEGSAVASGRMKSIRYPNGTTDVFMYSYDGDRFVVQKDAEYGDASGPHAPVEHLSIRDRFYLDARGREVERKRLVYTASGYSATPVHRVVSSYNEYSRLDEQKRVDGSNELLLYESTWTNGEKVSETDCYGVTTTFTYDALEQVATSTKAGIGPSGDYPAQPDIVTIYDDVSVESGCGCGAADSRSVIVNGITHQIIRKHNLAGRLLSLKDENGFVTSYSYADGGRVVTKTLPSGGSEIIEKYRDGQLKSITGTAVIARYFSHGTDIIGNRFTQTTIGLATSLRWEKTTMDMLGRRVEKAKPAFGSQNHLTEYAYNDEGRLAMVTEPGKAPMLYEYDAAGNVFRAGFKVDGAGSSLVPASNDRITETEAGFAMENGDWFYKLSTRVYATDASGTATTIEVVRERRSGYGAGIFSETSRLDAHQNATVEMETVDRAAKLVTLETTVPGSNIPAKGIIRNGLLQEENDSRLAASISYLHDGFGRRVQTIDPRRGVTKFTYREFSVDGQIFTGNLVETKEDPASHTTIYGFHESGAGAGQVSSQEDPDGKKTYFTYNLRGQQTHAWGSTYPVQYEYHSEFGWLSKQHTFRGGSDWFAPTWPAAPGTADTTTWHYQEKSGLLEAKEYADSTRTEYTYTTAGELFTRTWARQVSGQALVTTYTYWEDAGGDLKKVDYSDSTPDVEYTYTRAGQKETVTDAAGIRTFGYTAALQLETEEIVAGQNGLYGLLLTRKYEGAGTGEISGRPAGISIGTALDPDTDYDTTWNYDAAGRFARVQGPGLPSYGAEYGYLASSHRVETISYKTAPTTTAASSTYSPLPVRELVEVINNTAGSTTISQYDYVYDSVGKRTSVENTGSAFGHVAHNDYDYNDRRELIESKRYEGSIGNPMAEVRDQRRAYLFDSIGNRLSYTVGDEAPIGYISNSLNQYTAFDNQAPVHDADGNLSDDGQRKYSWDGENRLIEVKPAASPMMGDKRMTFAYDYMGRPVEKQVYEWTGSWSSVGIERFVYDDWNLLLVLDGGNSNQTLERFTWGLDIAEQASGLPAGARPGASVGGVGGLLAVSGTKDLVYFYDGNGNVVQLLEWDTETVDAHYEYDPFGNIVNSTGSRADQNRFRFSTKLFDAETEHYYFGCRYYSPDTGRWLNRDRSPEFSFEYLEWVYPENLAQNEYSFVDNDSINGIERGSWKID